MKRFILVSFLFLGWGYWELSGGADFVPETGPGGPEVVTRAEGTAGEPLSTGETGWATLAAEAAENAGASFIAAAAGGPTEPLDTPTDTAPAATVQPASAPVEEAPDTSGAPDFTFDSAAAALNAETGTEAVPGSEDAAPDLREIAASRVNMRQGPGTGFAVIDTLDGGTEMEVLEEDAAGWARVRATTTGQEGWMAARLLEPVGG